MARISEAQKKADKCVKNILVGYTTQIGSCVLIHRNQEKIIPPLSKQGARIMAALKYPHKWANTIAVFGRTPLGEEYMKSEAVVATTRYMQIKLAPIFMEYHAKLIPKIPEHQRVAVGWLASPAGVELTEKEAGDIFVALQAWNDECPTSAKSTEQSSDGSMSILNT